MSDWERPTSLNFFGGRVRLSILTNLSLGAVDNIVIPGQATDTPFIAWIDNSVGPVSPDTRLGVVDLA